MRSACMIVSTVAIPPLPRPAACHARPTRPTATHCKPAARDSAIPTYYLPELHPSDRTCIHVATRYMCTAHLQSELEPDLHLRDDLGLVQLHEVVVHSTGLAKIHPASRRFLSESGSHKVQHNLRTISDEVEFISRSKRGTSHFSSDLERAPGARSIAVEFVEVPPLVIELLRCENTAFHVHAAPFGIRTPFVVV